MLYPTPLSFPQNSSNEDTQEACQRFKVKPPDLNANRFEKLLRKTCINTDLQASLVRGWREGFRLGSKLPRVNHFSKSSTKLPEQRTALKEAMEKEKKLGRLHGPVTSPYYDKRWFTNCWVSPHFVIPKKTPTGEPQKWRVIHHLSFHESGDRRLSFNGHINLEAYPTLFPTCWTGVHLVF